MSGRRRRGRRKGRIRLDANGAGAWADGGLVCVRGGPLEWGWGCVYLPQLGAMRIVD